MSIERKTDSVKPYYKQKTMTTYLGDVVTYKKLCCGKCGMEFFTNKRIDNNYCNKCGTLIDWEGFEND